MRLARGSGRGRAERDAAGGGGRGHPLAPAAPRDAPGGAQRRGWRRRAWPGPRTRATPTPASTGCARALALPASPGSGSGRSGWPRRRGRWRGRGRRWSGRRPSSPRLCLADGGAGDLLLDPPPFAAGAEELRLRLLAAALSWVSGAVYRPRLVRARGGAGGGRGRRGRPRAHAARLRAARPRRAGRHPPRARPHGRRRCRWRRGRWDGRWAARGHAAGRAPASRIGALGAGGLARLPDHRPGPAREALAATPAIWRAGELVAAPVARPEPGFGFRRVSAVAPPWAPEIVR